MLPGPLSLYELRSPPGGPALNGQNSASNLYLVSLERGAPQEEPLLSQGSSESSDPFQGIFEANAGYVEDMYVRYGQNPQSVSPEWRAYFAGFKGGFAACIEAFAQGGLGALPQTQRAAAPGTEQAGAGALNTEFAVYQLTRAFQKFGHLAARLDPLGLAKPKELPLLLPETHGILSHELEALTAMGIHFGWAPMSVGEYVGKLRALFCGSVGIECEHVTSEDERVWLEKRFARLLIKPEAETRKAMALELARADAFEKTLATKYLGQKRFSAEGADAQVVAIESAMDHAASLGVKVVCMGKAHRGRLNVLVNVIGKPLSKLFAEFDGRRGPATRGDGDVKYHCGWESQRRSRSGHDVRVALSFNPSHLEFVDPVVLGECRAVGDMEFGGDRSKVLPVLMHGDAAFAGQGVVYETMQMMGIEGQRVGGCLHLLLNNQVGFTTNPSDSRSTRYCSDLGKAFGAPIFHVNADAIDAVHQVMCLAAEYRQSFGKDVIVDLVCFRRHGHNETDEPGFTQPEMYRHVKAKKAPFEDFSAQLVAEDSQTYSAEELDRGYQALRDSMTAAFDESQKNPDSIDMFPPSRRAPGLVYGSAEDILAPVTTGVKVTALVTMGERALEVPPGFTPNPKLERIVLAERREMLSGSKAIDWGMGEFLAYASLLSEGHSVRLCGQDAGRGTFSHRHAVLVDNNDEKRWLGLSQVATKGARIEVIDSLLSEAAAMGYEYGYATRNHNALTIWEGQFGDFCNGAQVIIDQFLVSGESKWCQAQGLVLFLPHGYEGQGPEHSSGRLERFMQLAAEGNMQVCVLTSAAQLFHALRRQVKRNFRKPLVIMTPKSFLRSPKAASSLDALENGQFQEVLPDPRPLVASDVERIVLCTGKVALDAFAYAETAGNEERLQAGRTAIVRVEQLYPLHAAKLRAQIAQYPKAKHVFWLQEEPQNMGAYHLIRDDIEDVLRSVKFKGTLRFIGRSRRASPAVGSPKTHAKELSALMDAVFQSVDGSLVSYD